VPADLRLDPRAQRRGVHRVIVLRPSGREAAKA
jgi:hypothetical protein